MTLKVSQIAIFSNSLPVSPKAESRGTSVSTFLHASTVEARTSISWNSKKTYVGFMATTVSSGSMPLVNNFQVSGISAAKYRGAVVEVNDPDVTELDQLIRSFLIL